MLRVELFLAAACLVTMPPQPTADLVIRQVRVVHGDGRVTPRATVVVRAGRVAAIAAGDVRGGPGARREVDGTGRTLIPGLIDAHVHVTDWALPLFLRY